VPPLSLFAPDDPGPVPGERVIAPGTITLNAGRSAVSIQVTNLADRPIQVGSHYPFIEANPYLRFDRAKAYGRRLDVPAGAAVRFEPGETRTVALVDLAGRRVIRGGNGIADGPVGQVGLAAAMERVRAFGFADEAET
jgi:urease beta subunit